MIDATETNSTNAGLTFDWKRALIAGIISGLVVLVVFRPIVDFLGGVIVESSNELLIAIADSLYERAAQKSLHGRLFLLTTQFGYVVTLFVTVLFVGAWAAYSEVKKRLPQEASPADENPEEHLNRLLRRGRRLGILGWVGIIFLWTTFFLLAASEFISTQAISEFRQTITVLAPVLNEDEEEIFESRWASMNSRRDFVALQTDLRVVATERGVTLPERVLD